MHEIIKALTRQPPLTIMRVLVLCPLLVLGGNTAEAEDRAA